MTNQIHEVNSLSEYISAIEEKELFNCISRGERTLYSEPCASGIKRKGSDGYRELMEEYYLEVEPNLSAVQDKHFPAFAQHHGIPTNLLDFSYSPLTSLYFSVDDCNEAGYVYFISRKRLVSINKIIQGRQFVWGMLNDILNFEPDLIQSLIPGMSKAFMSSREDCINFFEDHVQRLIDCHPNIQYDNSDRDSGEKRIEKLSVALEQYINDKERWKMEHPEEPVTLSIYSSFQNLLNGFHNIYYGVDILHPDTFYYNYRKFSENKGFRSIGSTSVLLLLFLMKYETLAFHHKELIEMRSEHMIEFPLYFTYRPPAIDERIRNQHSVFIFQPFGKLFPEDIPGGEIWQSIVPDYIIKVNEPKMIKQELDSIGINLKTIYSDYDSVAIYTVKNFISNFSDNR